MADPVVGKLPLRHPAENPTFIVMVILNFAILAILIDFLASAALIPPALRGTNWEAAWRAVAGAIILVAPAIMIVRQVQRASIRGTAVRLSRTQFPDLYASIDDFAGTSGGDAVHPRPRDRAYPAPSRGAVVQPGALLLAADPDPETDAVPAAGVLLRPERRGARADR
jgi:hypothetical protein